MAELPIIFDTESIRAIYAGIKTQTRRVRHERKPSPGYSWAECMCAEIDPADTPCVVCDQRYGLKYSRGDLLWVKETWCEYPGDDCPYEYRADNPDPLSLKWRSPLFMPRVASRLSLRVIDVRVQRLHDITEEDALAEGVVGIAGDHVTAYEHRWEHINRKRAPWASNPMVEVPTFERVPHG